MAEKENEPSKIIVDDDWKAQARAEKERLDEEVSSKKPEVPEAPAAAEAESAEQAGHGPLPPANFSSHVSSLAAQVLYALGGIEDQRTGQRHVDLDLAKYHIDTLSMLESKTEGNLDDEEKKLLDQALYQVRMQYVQLAQGGA